MTGLELGADDYVVKPFSTRELIARIKAVARRTRAVAQSLLTVEHLTPSKFQLLVVLGGVMVITEIAGAWHAASPSVPLATSLLALGAIAAVCVGPNDRKTRDAESEGLRRRQWVIAASTLLVSTWAGYYQFISLGVGADTPVLTLAWLAAGLAVIGKGLRGRVNAMRDAGALVVGPAVVKALVYDTTQLSGVQRVAVCAVGGVVLLVISQVMSPRSAS